MAQSVEPMIADKMNNQLKSYGLDYKLEQESLNTEIDKALKNYESKSWWKWGNRPDAKLLLKEWKTLKYRPILIEYKWKKWALEKLDKNWYVENKDEKNEYIYKNIKEYAVNWAVHYSNALLHYTDYEDVIAIWVNGYNDWLWNLQHEIWVYYVSKKNLWVGQKIWEYTDLSFLAKENFDGFIKHVNELTLSESEFERIKAQREREIGISLIKLNNDIYQSEKWLGEDDRVYLVAASIIATLWIHWKVPPLEAEELKWLEYEWGRDWDIMINRITAFLDERNLPKDKKDLILNILKKTLTTENINKVENWESQLKRVFSKIIDDLGFYYKIVRTDDSRLFVDFTGKLFNEMYNWLGFSKDELNDVVLTPPYVWKLLVKLARVNKDSYVWDFATWSAWLLVAAMNEMILDAKNEIHSPQELALKEARIKAEQLLWLEILPSIYMLAVLNMILVWDGSSNILNQDSLKFDWKYWYWKQNENFPADAFILNPPYSAKWNGMIFVEKALSMMDKWYAAIIIQSSAWNWKAEDYNKRILKKHTLLASIKMPIDLFIWKSSVQTNIYVFKVNEKHNKDDIVKFIDFSNDWYSRWARKKAKNSNLKDVDNAKWRYQEVVDLVRFWKEKLKIFTEKEYYEWHIDPENWRDWNQTAPIDTKPTLKDFKKTVSDYLAWETSTIIKNKNNEEDCLGK